MSRQGIMLAYPFDERRLSRWDGQIFIQPKLDGNRCRAVMLDPEDPVFLYSSEMNLFSFPHIEDDLQEMLRPWTPCFMDGELYRHGLPHSRIQSITSTTTFPHPDREVMQFHVFDFVQMDKIKEQRQAERLGVLQAIMSNVPARSSVKLVPTQALRSREEMWENLSEYMLEGYEGFIIRAGSNLYVPKRSIEMMKFKPRSEDTYEIVGTLEEISINDEPKNSLGALVLRDMGGEQFKVGTGPFLTRENRRTLWQNREALIGLHATLKYQELTERSVPRFPVLIEVS